MNETIARDGYPPNLLSDEITGDIQVARVQNRNLCLAVGFQRSVRKSEAGKLFVRYQVQTERLYRRDVEEFKRLKKLRARLPNEANNEPIAKPINEPIAAPEPIAPEDLMPPLRRPGESEAGLDFIARFDEFDAHEGTAKTNPNPRVSQSECQAQTASQPLKGARPTVTPKPATTGSGIICYHKEDPRGITARYFQPCPIGDPCPQ
jgi:hypothetical protein